MNHIPIPDEPRLRLELEGVRISVIHMLQSHSETINKEVDRQLREYLTPQNVAADVGAAIRAVVPQAIHAAVRHYFDHGEGRGVITDAVRAAINATTR